MMYADLIDQEDLLGQLKALGIQVPSGTTADQACECAVRGLDTVSYTHLTLPTIYSV